MNEQKIHRENNEYIIAYNRVTGLYVTLEYFSVFENLKFDINKVVIIQDIFGRTKEIKKEYKLNFHSILIKQ